MTGSTHVDWADTLDAAIEQVAQLGPVGPGNESRLHRRLREALRCTGSLRALDKEGRLHRHKIWWTRAPGGIDVVALRDSGDREYALGIECKIGKPDELLWDAIKLGQRCGEDPWDHGLEAGAIVVEVSDTALRTPRAGAWFDPSVTEVDTIEAIAGWPEAWYGLMCGGRGVRPTSLPRKLMLGRGRSVKHPGGASALCWRLIIASALDGDDRIPVDSQGWPLQMTISDEWRRQIDRAAETSSRPPITLRERSVLERPPARTVAQIVSDEEGRLWADAWDTRETVPTSFRLVETDLPRYDLMRAKNDALRFVDPPRQLPGWCALAVAEALRTATSD